MMTSVGMMMVIVGALVAILLGIAISRRRERSSSSAHGSVLAQDDPLRLGVRMTWNRILRGIEILEVFPDTPAAEVLELGDVLTHYSLDGENIRALTSVQHLVRIVNDLDEAGGGLLYVLVMQQDGTAFWAELSIGGGQVLHMERSRRRDLPRP
jgi:hypothetical protein